jgi:hypothetical protein
MSASMAGDGILAFRGNAFHAARNVAARTLRPPQQPATTNPLIVSATGFGTIGRQCGCYLSPDADAAYGDVILQVGNSGGPLTIVMRFPGTTTGGAPPAAGGLFVSAAPWAIVQADNPAPTVAAAVTASGGPGTIGPVTFVSTAGITVGQVARDNTTPGAIIPGTTVATVNATQITLSAPIQLPGIGIGDQLAFGQPTTDVQWTLTYLGGPDTPGRLWRLHYEWNISH